MDKLINTIEKHGRWSGLIIYTERIGSCISTDFSMALENAKALLETISKEICKEKGVELKAKSSINGVLKKAFSALGYVGSDLVTQVSSALATIGQQVGQLRNEIGTTSHGKSLDELGERNDKVDELTKEFLIDSVVAIACFLIKTFEAENPRIKPVEASSKIVYIDNEEFNEFWDDTYGEFEMGEYSYSASEILYNVDYEAYVTEHKVYVE